MVLLIDWKESDGRSRGSDSEEHLVEAHIEVADQQAANEHDSWVGAADVGGRGVCGVGRGGGIALAAH